MTVTLRLTFLTSSYAQVVLVFPLVVVAGAYFAGRMPLGGIFQTSKLRPGPDGTLLDRAELFGSHGWFATVQRLYKTTE